MTRAHSLSALGKHYGYRTGMLGAWHRGRNRRRITVAMFHRVLPRAHPAWLYSEPSWLLAEDVFAECLRFFARHYTVIGLPRLLAIRDGPETAPRRPLLITFDDGWSDTAEYAAPLLQQHGMPALVFVVTDGIGRHELWHEALLRVWRQKRLKAREGRRLWEAAAPAGLPAPSSWEDVNAIWALVRRLGKLEPAGRDRLLEEIVHGPGVPEKPEMLSRADLQRLHCNGISIGSHGVTHTPIPQAADGAWEFAHSRTTLARMLGDPAHDGLQAFSFPRGIYDSGAVSAAGRCGYRLLFTSDEHLNPIPAAAAAPAVLGRINIPSTVIGAGGRFEPAALATWLFLRGDQKAGRI